jgi:hypothetical protein
VIAIASLVLPIALGWVWCRALRVLPGTRGPEFGLANIPAIAGCEIAILLVGVALLLRQRRDVVSASPPAWRWTSVHYVLAAALIVLTCLAGAITASTYASAPHGRWDAWAIWNLRAKYLAGEGTWRNAVSPLLAETHPEYPLGTPALIARTWVYGGRDFDPRVPAVIAALYALATLLILVGALGTIRGPTIGLLAGCILLCGQSWVAEVGSQYADVPLGLYFVAVLALVAVAIASESEGVSNHRAAVLAGLLAAFGAFVKNEGLAFVAVVLVALAVTSNGRRQWRAFAIGLAPALVLVLLYKVFVAPSDPSLAQGLGAMISKASDFSRWRAIASALAERAWTLGEWYAHPILLAGVVWFVLRPRRETQRQGAVGWFAANFAGNSAAPQSIIGQALPLGIASALMIAAYVGAYLISPAELKWQLDTSADRLLVQILPAVLVSVFMAAAPELAVAPAIAERKPVASLKAAGKVASRKRKVAARL